MVQIPIQIIIENSIFSNNLFLEVQIHLYHKWRGEYSHDLRFCTIWRIFHSRSILAIKVKFPAGKVVYQNTEQYNPKQGNSCKICKFGLSVD